MLMSFVPLIEERCLIPDPALMRLAGWKPNHEVAKASMASAMLMLPCALTETRDLPAGQLSANCSQAEGTARFGSWYDGDEGRMAQILDHVSRARQRLPRRWKAGRVKRR